jgi:ankyrin repeat protein
MLFIILFNNLIPFFFSSHSTRYDIILNTIFFFVSFLNRALIKACTQGNVTAVRKLLKQGISVNETSEEGESLLSLACSAGYYELAQVSVNR